MNRVLILGANGLLGHSLVPWLRGLSYEVIRAGRNQDEDFIIDLHDRHSLTSLIREIAPNYVINLVGATNVDQCETDIGYAYNGNVAVVANLAAVMKDCADLSLHLVHLSTDQLYDGLGLQDEKRIKPVNVYALSKFAGELALAASPAAILRTNFFGRSHCPSRVSFTDWLVNSLRGESQFTLFTDVIFNAVHMNTLCDIIHRVMHQRLVGVFNVGSRGAISKAEFGLRLAELLGISSKHIRQGSVSDAVLKARRPKDMSMSIERLESALAFQCPSIEDEILRAAREYFYA